MLIVALAPAVLVATLLSLWFVVDRINDVERTELRRAHTIASGLALAGEYGVASGNAALLADISRPTLSTSSIARIRFADRDDTILLSAGETTAPTPGTAGLGARLMSVFLDLDRLHEIEQPILRTDLSSYEDPLFPSTAADGEPGVPDDAGGEAQRVGTLYVTVDLSTAYRRQFEGVDRALLVSLLVLLAAMPAAIWLARSVIRPVRTVTEAVVRLARHDYVKRIPVRGGGELEELAHGVLHLSQELRSFHRRLQESTRMATDDLHLALDALEQRNRELIEARTTAERASDFKSEFLANMSHEIRTPMNTIVGTLSTLKRSALDDDQHEQVRQIDGASNDLLALIDDILDITKIETGNLRMESVPCDLGEMLEQVFCGMAHLAMERGVELRVAPLPPDVPVRVRTDPLRLKQVLLNLLSNAIKFTVEGHVLLSVSRAAPVADAPGGAHALRLVVADTGIGIPEHLQTSLFAAFAQADMSTTRRFGGAGLGLHICRGIVELAGGDIGLESVPGEGSRFKVTLPVDWTEEAGERAKAVDSRTPLALRYRARYRPLESVDRQALTLAGVVLDGAVPDGAETGETVDGEAPGQGHAGTMVPHPGHGSPLLIGVPNRLLRQAVLGEPIELVLPPTPARRLALVSRVTPDIRRRLREAGFDGHVTYSPRPEELRRHLEAALGGTAALSPLARASAARGSTSPVRGSDVFSPDVLAVDDQPANLDLLARYFKHLGVNGAFARSGEEAELELRSRRFDLVLLDLHMPGRDGFSIANRLRTGDSPNRATPVVALTADAYAESHARALAGGFDAVLTKPLTIDRLRSELLLRVAGFDELSGDASRPVAGMSLEHVPHTRESRVRAPSGIASITACAAGMMGNVEWARGAIATYREEIPSHVEALRAAIDGDDRARLGEVAHALKGVSDICRVTAVADAARELEIASESGGGERITSCGATLLALLERAAADCDRELERVAASQ